MNDSFLHSAILIPEKVSLLCKYVCVTALHNTEEVHSLS